MSEPKTPRDLVNETAELLKTASSLAGKDGSGELTEALMNARENIQALREALADLDAKQVQLDQRLAEIDRSSAMEERMVRASGVYWVEADNDPWCPNCWEAERRAVHLNPSGLMGGRLVTCTRCNYSINLDNVSPPKTWPKSKSSS